MLSGAYFAFPCELGHAHQVQPVPVLVAAEQPGTARSGSAAPAVLAAPQRPIAEQEPHHQAASEQQDEHEPAHLFHVLAHVTCCLLDVPERRRKSLYRLPLDLGALLPHGTLYSLGGLTLKIHPGTLQLHPLGLELLDGGSARFCSV